MESLQSLEDMRLEFERLEAEESEIDRELGELIKQQPNLLIKGKILLQYEPNMMERQMKNSH